MKDFTYYAYGDRRPEPYALMRFDPVTGRLERYAEGGEWVFSPTEVDVLFYPDPDETATVIDKAEADALIASGVLLPLLSRETIAGFGR